MRVVATDTEAHGQSDPQPIPESEGAVIRCALESLALKTRHVHGQLQRRLLERVKPMEIWFLSEEGYISRVTDKGTIGNQPVRFF